MTAAFVERRKDPRSEVRLLVLFPGGQGYTGDISPGGLCFETTDIQSLVARETVCLEIHLPERPPFTPATVVSGQGEVTRLHRCGSQESVGARPEGRCQWRVAFKFRHRLEVCNFR